MDPAELQKAGERIGATSEKALQWLLRFLSADLAKLTEGERLDLENELNFFVIEPPPGLRAGWEIGRKSLRGRQAKIPAHLRPTFRLKLSVARAQELLDHWIDALMRYDIVEFKPMTLTLQLFHPKCFLPKFSDADLPESGGCWVYFDSHEEAFGYHAAHVLGAHLGRLRYCDECQGIFLADRRQQVFCSTRCLNRVTQRRWREKTNKKPDAEEQKSKKRRIRSSGGSAHGKKKR